MMNRFLHYLTLLLMILALALPAAVPAAADPDVTASAESAIRTTVLEIRGMQCDGCATVIHTALSKVKGVKSVAVSRARGEATVTFDTGQTSVAQLIRAVETAQGMAPYKAREKRG
jgi:copper chaperone CopZ